MKKNLWGFITVSALFQVVIKYVPYVGDSKRAMDEYTSEIMMGGTNTIAMHNTCEVGIHLQNQFSSFQCGFYLQNKCCWELFFLISARSSLVPEYYS